MDKKNLKRTRACNIDLDDIGSSTSLFGDNAEKYLNIHIVNVDSFDDIINHGIDDKEKIIVNDDIVGNLKELVLEDISRDDIRLFKTDKIKNLSKPAQTFVYKLSLVVNNNYVMIEPPHIEDYIHDLVDNVLKNALFEDGIDLLLMPCILRLNIGGENYAAYGDKEGRRGTEIIWIIDEDKHKFDKRWKKGDIQLIANMIAAAQTNKAILGHIYPRRMLGIKFDADNIFFYSTYITDEYLNGLLSKSPCENKLEVRKFPKDRELSLSQQDTRKELFKYLTAMRTYAMKLEPRYQE